MKLDKQLFKTRARNLTDKQKDKLFSEICNKQDWKDEVIAIIDEDKFDLYNESYCYFCGGSLEIIKKLPNGKIKVYGYGYHVHIGM
tara:strand:+ start:474 stop:731 length:258 start_codon:yes stop_codon:yes gene_type:complete